MADKTLHRVSSKIGFRIRPMQRTDIDKCLLIWSRVELTEGYSTVASNLAEDPSGFYVAELEDSDEVVGMCASPITRPDTAFIGFYAVDPAYQGLGIGRELWSKTLGRLGPSINIGLYGVPEMVEKYKNAGFGVEDSMTMIIYESERGKADELRLDTLKDIDSLDANCHFAIINKETGNRCLDDLIKYDQAVQGFSREGLLRKYLLRDDPLTIVLKRRTGSSEPENLDDSSQSSCDTQQPGEQGRDDMSSDQQGGRTSHESNILGYGCIRRDNNSGGMVGPIYADSEDICEIILRNLLSRFDLEPGQIYSVMPLSSNECAIKILQKLGLREVERCSRLFTKFVPSAPYSKIFYVHSPNFSLF